MITSIDIILRVLISLLLVFCTPPVVRDHGPTSAPSLEQRSKMALFAPSIVESTIGSADLVQRGHPKPSDRTFYDAVVSDQASIVTTPFLTYSPLSLIDRFVRKICFKAMPSVSWFHILGLASQFYLLHILVLRITLPPRGRQFSRKDIVQLQFRERLAMIPQKQTAIHWDYFIALENDLSQFSRFLEIAESNFSSYSIELGRIFFAAASEVDVVAKILPQHRS